MKKNYTMKDYLKAYKYAYLATTINAKQARVFRNTHDGFLKALSEATERVIEEENVTRGMIRRAKITMAYYVSREYDCMRRHYLESVLARWSYMDGVFNGSMPLSALKMCADARMQKLGVNMESETLKNYFMRLHRMGVTVKDIKRVIEAA